MGWMIKGAVLSLLGAFVLSPSAFGQTVEWAKSAGGSMTDTASSIATTPRGESYVTGQFLGTATFGPGEDNETTLTSGGGAVIFVAKYGRDGELLWATRVIGTSSHGFGIATTPRGESYVTGLLQDTAIFGPGEDNETTLTAVGDTDFFLAKYDRDGELLWATQASGDSSFALGRGIATTPRGESYRDRVFH